MNPGEGAAYTPTIFKPQQSLWAEAAQFRGEQRRADNRGTEASTESIALRSKGSYNCQRDITRGCSRKHRGVQMTCPQVPLGALASPAGVFLAPLNNSHMNWGNKKMCEITTAWVIRWAGGAPNRKPSWILFPALSISAISVALESFQGSLNSIQPSKFNKALL